MGTDLCPDGVLERDQPVSSGVWSQRLDPDSSLENPKGKRPLKMRSMEETAGGVSYTSRFWKDRAASFLMC